MQESSVQTRLENIVYELEKFYAYHKIGHVYTHYLRQMYYDEAKYFLEINFHSNWTEKFNQINQILNKNVQTFKIFPTSKNYREYETGLLLVSSRNEIVSIILSIFEDGDNLWVVDLDTCEGDFWFPSQSD